jgi:hypothetical protein
MFSLFLALWFVACGDLQLRPSKEGCLHELACVEQAGYSVHALRDGCGGATEGFMLYVEQRMPLFPGLYLVRSVDVFDGAYEGNLTVVGPNQIRIHIPKGVDGSYWRQEVDRIYQLKPHVYF